MRKHLEHLPAFFLGGTLSLCTVSGNDADADLQRCDPPRTKQSHPYCYDPFTIWGEPRPSAVCNGSVFTDRLEQCDRAKYVHLMHKHYRCGESDYVHPFALDNCQGRLIQAFLRDWFDDPKLRLLRVVEYCNQGTGYPTWSLDYHSVKKKD